MTLSQVARLDLVECGRCQSNAVRDRAFYLQEDSSPAQLSGLVAMDLTGVTVPLCDVPPPLTVLDFTGQKIKLGENVIAALRKMSCPSLLQPHQIRGLDFAALFPVFQWLVKHVLATREERGAQIRKYSELKFSASHGKPDAAALSGHCFCSIRPLLLLY